MRIPQGLLMVATVLGLTACGCSNEPQGDFQQARDDGTVADPRADAQLAKQSRKPAARQPVVAQRPTPRANPMETSLVASLGFGGGTIVGDMPVQTAEQRLPPAIGSASTLALVARVDSSLENTAGNLKRVEAREVKLLVPEKSFRKEGDALRVSYDDLDLLKVLNMEPVTPNAPELMPDWMKNLHGKRIRIRGFMSPAYRATGIRSFLMGRDNKACCFPGRAKIYDLFPVILKKGNTTHYIQNRPFDVVGTFQIRPWIEDGEILRLYRIVDARIVK